VPLPKAPRPIDTGRAALGGLVLAALALTACGGDKPPATPSATPAGHPSVSDWRSIATTDDRRRLREWRTAWMAAVAKARTGGHGADIAARGVLLEPDAALAPPDPPPGDYACSVTKIGAKSAGLLDYVAYPAFTCRISAQSGALRLEKLSGSQRPLGTLYRDNGMRLIFLGTVALGDERAALAYGRDTQRDMAGIFERIGSNRWRLVLPHPAWESMLDVIEFTPKP
jgi:hypothetical protein